MLQQGDCRFKYHVYFLLSLTLLEVTAVHRSVMKDNMFGASYVWTHILVSDDCETEILDSEGDLPATPQHNHDIVPSILLVTVKQV